MSLNIWCILPPQVSEIQSRSAQLEVQNNHLDSDLKLCERKSKEAAAEAASQLQSKQRSHDDQVDATARKLHHQSNGRNTLYFD